MYRDMARYWDDSLIGSFESFWRPKVHLVSHFCDLYLALGTPVHWSTMYFIEPMQRLVKAAHGRSSKFNPDGQILRRLTVLGHVRKWLTPLLGDAHDRRRKRDEPIQAFLRGTLKSVPGVNTVYEAPVNAEQLAWNTAIQQAVINSGVVPKGHIVTHDRIFVRREGTFIREGLCDTTVRATPRIPQMCDATERAIFSLYDAGVGPEAVAPAGGGVAADPVVVQPNVESTEDRFIVDWWISYDIRGLSPESPNAGHGLPKLTTAQVNDAAYAVDLAVGHNLQTMPTVTNRSGLREQYAKVIFKRVKQQKKLVVRDIGYLCQPLWSFPVLGTVTDAQQFFRAQSSKWDATQWLILPKLY
jgi:hypothetical protein